MQENLVGYLLGALDADSQREVEKYLDQEPGARQQLDLLRRALTPLEADKDTIDPPAGLVIRTLGRVAEHRCRPLPPAPTPPPVRLVGGGRPWWRRADVLAAACLLIAIGGLGTTWIANQRAEARKAECQHNLQQGWYPVLVDYAQKSSNNELPQLDSENRRHVAGAFVSLLKEKTVLPPELSLRCPANGPRHQEAPTLKQLEDMSDQEFAEKSRDLGGCYAYPLGYRQNGKLNAPQLQSDVYMTSVLPVLADCPAMSGEHGEQRGNSLNHHGQNVLFRGGQVRFCKTPFTPFNENDNIYLNNEGKVAAGVDKWDTVLGCHDDHP